MPACRSSHPFFDDGDPEALGTSRLQRRGDRTGAMTVGVGLDHGKNLPAGGLPPDLTEIVHKGIQVDFYMGWSLAMHAESPSKRGINLFTTRESGL